MGRSIFQERLLIAAGALLHDIGKFELRTLTEKERNSLLSQVGRDEKAKDQEIAFIYQLADQASSKERSLHVKDEKFKELNYLRSIFQNISLFSGKEHKDEYAYDLEPLSSSREKIFPKPLKKLEESSIEEKYRKLLKNFEEEFKKVNFKNFTEKELVRLYFLCYKYFWCIPASTYDKGQGNSHYPDISLFDHARVASAIGASLYTEENLQNLKNSQFILVRGDISGIQKFLYSLSNLKHIAKRLRGRSAFLALLPELIAIYVLHRLNYPFSNLLFASGGHFELLIGYEKDVEEKLNNLEKEVESVLLKNFYGSLGLVLAYTKISLPEFQTYPEIIKKLFEKIDLKKKRKFAVALKEEKGFEALLNKDYENPSETYIVCPSCRLAIVEEKEAEEEDNVCRWCKIFAEVGGIIPKSRFVVFSEKKPSDLKGFHLEGIGGIYFAEKDLGRGEGGLVFLMNDTDFLDKGADGFKFLAISVPREKQESSQREEIMSFEVLCEQAEGDKKLSFARADVDNLGLIFRKGLGDEYSISRVATLSRSLDLFFSGYLNKLFEKEPFKQTIYTLYAGGDDLFIIGPWDKIMQALLKIKKDFSEYTCQNETFDISSGVFTGRHDYPMRFAGELAGKAEDKAKEKKREEGRAFVCILDEVLDWKALEKAIEKGERIVSLIERKEIGRTLFYKLYFLLRQYKKAEEEKSELKYRFYPMFYYYLYRNVKEEYRREVIDYLIEVDKDYKVREDALFRAKYVLMKTRKS